MCVSCESPRNFFASPRSVMLCFNWNTNLCMTLIPLLNSVSLIIIIRATGIHIMCILHFTSSSSNCTTSVGICFSFSESAAKSEIMFICLVKLASARLSHKLLMNPKKVADKSVEKLSKFLCFSYFFRVLRIKKFAHCFLSKFYVSNDNIRGSFHFTWSTNTLSEWHEQNMVIYTHNEQSSFHVTCCLTLFQCEIHSRMTEFVWRPLIKQRQACFSGSGCSRVSLKLQQSALGLHLVGS